MTPQRIFAICLTLTSLHAVAQRNSSSQPTAPDAQERLGTQYFGQRDYTTALIWYRKAADQGNAEAQNDIGWLYQYSLGVKQDYAEAAVWYRKAADHGNAKAQGNLGWLYQNGWGVKQDYTEAATWFLEAANRGNATAQCNLG